MDLLPKNKSLQYAFVVFAALVNINFWSFQPVPDIVYNVLGAVAMLGFVVVVIWNSYVFNKSSVLFRNNVLFFAFIPFLSAIGAYVYHHQSFSLSLTLLRPNLFWLFYFVLHVFEIDKKKLIKLMIFIGCVWAFLTIVQQFTYPHAYFFTRGDEDGGSGDDSTIYRAGVYRFMLGGQQYGLFVLLYFFYNYLTTKSNKRIYFLPFVLYAIIGFYYYGTRQYALAAVLSMGMAIMFLKPAARGKYLALAIPTILLLWGLKHILFGQYIDLTNRQMQYGYDQDVRVLCGKFYLFDYWPHWTAKIIGNGPPHMLSDYGREMALILAYFHFYRSDVGIIGSFNKFGILYVINLFWIIIKVARIGGLDKRDKYLKLFFYNALFLIILSDSFSKGMVFYCLVLYLIDKSIEEQKQERVILQQDLYAEPELDYT